MTRLSPDNVSLVFASLAHAFMHMFAAYYFTIVLALEIAWDRPFAELIALWTPAAILIGLAAVPAGWLADRWSARAMIALAFAGMGAFSIIAGFTKGPATMLPILAAVGIFAAVYHPVGIPWVMRVAYRNPGKALAINGLFGGVGVGFAGLTAGTLIDVAGWPAAFIVPGLVSLAVAAAMALLIRAGRVAEPDRQPDSKTGQPTRDERLRGVTILLATTFAGGLTYQVTQSAAPKLFDGRPLELEGRVSRRLVHQSANAVAGRVAGWSGTGHRRNYHDNRSDQRLAGGKPVVRPLRSGAPPWLVLRSALRAGAGCGADRHPVRRLRTIGDRRFRLALLDPGGHRIGGDRRHRLPAAGARRSGFRRRKNRRRRSRVVALR
jgi:MFS family permease